MTNDEFFAEEEKFDDAKSNIIMFPDYERLKDDMQKLKTELSMLLLERDELQFVICKNIETKYMLEIGGLEYKAYEIECKLLRIKRKIELIQAKLNREEHVDISEIEETLDREFLTYQERLNEMLCKMNEAITRSNGEFLSDKETADCKKLYRKIVKSLHPDMNPNLTETQLTLFENAVEAYKNGDLKTLRFIADLVEEKVLPERSNDAITVLKKRIDRLHEMAAEVRGQIARIQSEFPYTAKSLVENPEALAKRKCDVEARIENLKNSIEIYQARINHIL